MSSDLYLEKNTFLQNMINYKVEDYEIPYLLLVDNFLISLKILEIDPKHLRSIENTLAIDVLAYISKIVNFDKK